MSSFTVVVRTASGALTYPAIGTSAAAVHMDALERFGACGVTVRPQGAAARSPTCAVFAITAIEARRCE